MWLVVIAVILIALKAGDVGFAATWPWWAVLSPLAGALVWWAYADASGYTKRREMDKLEAKKVERRRKSLEALGIDRDRQKVEDAAARARRIAAARVEDARAVKRKQNEQVIRDSVFDSTKMTTTFDELEAEKREKP
jgi:small Trp-rich protein